MRGLKLLIVLLTLCYTSTGVKSQPLSTSAPTTVATPVEPRICQECACKGGSIDCSKKGFLSVPVEQFLELVAAGVRVSTIDLSNNSITIIKATDFLMVGENLTVLDLRWNKISVVEDEAFISAQKDFTLQLAYNQLETLPDNCLHKRRLKLLNLKNNRLRSIPRALRNTVSIERLHIEENPLIRLSNDSFDGISRLIELDLSRCGLTEFEICNYSSDAFYSLRTLYLDQNHMTTIKSNHFYCHDANIQPLAAVNKLSIRQSGVQVIEDRSFQGLFQIRQLHLSGNNLTVFKQHVFFGLSNLHEIDLSYCNITDVKRVVFKELRNLERLLMDNNNIEVLHHRDFSAFAFSGPRVIHLSKSKIRRIAGAPFENLTNLEELYLDNNLLGDDSIPGLGRKGRFDYLNLANNKFEHIPNLPIRNNNSEPAFGELNELILSGNSIFEIRAQDLTDMHYLTRLNLRKNSIFRIDDNAFIGVPALTRLDLDNMKIKQLPQLNLPKLMQLHVKNGQLESLPEDLCDQLPSLVDIEAERNQLTTLPSFKNCNNIILLVAAHNKITTLRPDTLEKQRKLVTLRLEDNQIEEIPERFFEDTGKLTVLNLDKNKIRSLPEGVFNTTAFLTNVHLSYNQLTSLNDGLFEKTAGHLHTLALDNNYLTAFGSSVLPEGSALTSLNLSANNIREINFPYSGLLWLSTFHVEENFGLLQVPVVAAYPNVSDVRYTFAYHCCIWSENYREPINPPENSTAPHRTIPTPEPIVLPTLDGLHCANGELTREGEIFWTAFRELHNANFTVSEDCVITIFAPEDPEEPDDVDILFSPSGHRPPPPVYRSTLRCTPAPNDFSPCTNLLDPWGLRGMVWFLWIMALLGNGAVLFISLATKEKLEVYQILICCLACADFLFGVYLALLAAVDIRSYGELSFYQSALSWQLGPGCKAAGFIAVFASVLSVFVLVLLTLERVYTIAYTFNQNEKEKKRVAIIAAVVACMISATLAALPLVDINSYTKVAVCLPYVTEKWTDKAYIGVLLTIHLISFFIIVLSYAYIFRSICKSPAAQQKKRDISIAAAKIAVLIITAFVCWIPIVIIGYLAVGDLRPVNTYQAKFLVVLLYPMNACLNPFIYAIFTRQFRQRVSVFMRRSNVRMGTLPSLPSMRRPSIKRGSNAFLPRNSSPIELINLRQSRRSTSLSVQVSTNNPSTPPVRSPPSLSPPPGVCMGRRASLPAMFGSSLMRAPQIGGRDSHGGSMSTNDSNADVSALPFRFAPGFGTIQPRLDNENLPNVTVVGLTNLNISIDGSQDSSNRQLPDIPEEQEDENVSLCSSDYHDAQEELGDVAIDYELSSSYSIQSVSDATVQVNSKIEDCRPGLRDSLDSAYIGGESVTPDIAIMGKATSSPAHSFTLSQGESFASYDIAVSDSEFHDYQHSASLCVPSKRSRIYMETTLPQNTQQSDSDPCVNCTAQSTHSAAHESTDTCTPESRHIPTELDSPQHKTNDNFSNSAISIIGSETSI